MDDGLDPSRGILVSFMAGLSFYALVAYFWGGRILETVAGWFA